MVGAALKWSQWAVGSSLHEETAQSRGPPGRKGAQTAIPLLLHSAQRPWWVALRTTFPNTVNSKTDLSGKFLSISNQRVANQTFPCVIWSVNPRGYFGRVQSNSEAKGEIFCVSLAPHLAQITQRSPGPMQHTTLTCLPYERAKGLPPNTSSPQKERDTNSKLFPWVGMYFNWSACLARVQPWAQSPAPQKPKETIFLHLKYRHL